MRWWGLILLAASIPLIGEILGHGYMSAVGNALTHHAFHAATVIAGAGIFWFLVVQDIRRNGVPPRLAWVERAFKSLRGAQGTR